MRIRVLLPATFLILSFARFAAADPTGTCVGLGAPLTGTAASGNARVATADFNEDGILDLVTTGGNANFSVYLGLGTAGVGNGTFAAPTSYPSIGARDFAIGDFNHDGILDLAFTVPAGVGLRFGQGSGGVGDGTFGAQSTLTLSVPQTAIITRDFNEDGILDLAVASGNGPYAISVFLGLGANGVGNGTFGAPVGYTVAALPNAIVTGDFNHDGRLDLAMTAGGNVIHTLMGAGTGAKGNGAFITPATNYIVNTLGGQIVTGDFNEDGRTDLAFTEIAGDVAVMLGNGTGSVGDGTFAAPSRYWVGPQARGLGVADFNGDGIADLAVALFGGDSVAVMVGGGAFTTGNGTFLFAGRFRAAPGPLPLLVQDFKSDNIPDVLVANFDTTAVQMFPGMCASAYATNSLLTSPNGGEAWNIGSEHTITWNKDNGIMAMDVEISRDDGANWDVIATNVTGTSFDWTVTGPQTGLAKVRIYDSAVRSRREVSDTTFVIEPSAAGVGPPVAEGIQLGIPAPNPFSRSVRLTLSVPRAVSHAEVVVCSVDGRVVSRLHSGALSAGDRTLEWNGRLANGRRATPGVYFVRATWPGAEATQRTVLLE